MYLAQRLCPTCLGLSSCFYISQLCFFFPLSFVPKSLLPLLLFSCSKHSGWLVNCAVVSKGRQILLCLSGCRLSFAMHFLKMICMI